MDSDYLWGTSGGLALLQSHADVVKQRDEFLRCNGEDQQLIIETIRQRDLYMGMVHDLEAQAATHRERIAQLERERMILAGRCATQAHAIATMLARTAPPFTDQPAEPAPVFAAIEAMQRGGVR